ncbi:uncharacterized protein LOC126851293 isoform X2 [Cataglyphis hispanica]|uniref:uncharacterized protein LOC126851293 isoform X2 n=1 Tax=Cataglyphis hispanica TaxID=1086592 RepID=UPI002180129F|nr:uncharacterized protein LOC126851293 isoform X2 [Cataglyphis hispanica]
MRSKLRATSGPVFSLYLSFVLLVVLISVSDKAYAKRGCASFGHSCFGGHGKRFDSAMRHETLQESGSQRFQESNVPSPNDDNELFYVLPNDEFRERSDRSLPFTRTRKDTQQFDPYPLSSLLNQWHLIVARIAQKQISVINKESVQASYLRASRLNSFARIYLEGIDCYLDYLIMLKSDYHFILLLCIFFRNMTIRFPI